MPRLVIIDSNDAERRRIASSLTLAGFEMREASGSVEGLLEVLDSAPDLIILSEEMPPLQAADLLVILRSAADAPIIVIGGGGDPEEIAALESGADSYVRRGASLRLLRTRADALLRRYPHLSSCVAPLGPAPTSIYLTATERRLLTCLSNHGGRPVSLQDLRAEVWGGRAGTDAVKYCLRRLRHKLEVELRGLELRCIRGVGYRLERTEALSATGGAAAGVNARPERMGVA